MDIGGFWKLIEDSKALCADPGERLEWLTDQLAALPTRDIEDFHVHLSNTRRRVDTWGMWGAAYLICDSLCSNDGFWYFQAWLVGLGRTAFERVAADPDALAELPEVQRLAGRKPDTWSDAEWPEWESLSYVANAAHERLTGEQESLYDALEARGHRHQSDPDPQDERWNFEDAGEAARRLPRLSRMFPLTDRAQRDARGKAAFDELLRERGQTEAEFMAELGLSAPRESGHGS